MKWFKHMTNMRNDMFIKALRCEFGLDGYAIYNMILEIYGDECGADPGREIEFDMKVLAQEIGIKVKTLQKVLSFCAEANKFVIVFCAQKVKISIPKMQSICDDWSRKLRSNSGIRSQIPDLPEVRDQIQEPDKYKYSSSSITDGPNDDEKKFFSGEDTGLPEGIGIMLLEHKNPSLSSQQRCRLISDHTLFFKHVLREKPDVSEKKLLKAWRETLLAAIKHEARLSRWYETTFYDKLEQLGVCVPARAP